MSNRQKAPTPPKRKSFAFVVDGQTEKWYLDKLKENERLHEFKITPKIPNKKKLKGQFVEVCKLAEKEFDTVFWIIDLDTINGESREAKKGDKKPFDDLKDYKSEINKKFPNVVVIVNNPCLEFWFLLHFEQTGKYYPKCKSVESLLKSKDFIPAYEKSEKFFKKQDEDIYKKLKPQLANAIRNASRLGEFDGENAEKALCEMFLLFKEKEFEAVARSAENLK